MSDYFREHVPNLKGLANCTECDKPLVQDIFIIPKEHGTPERKGGLLEAIACMDCKIIHEVLSE